jgi:hypothetical protein
MASNGSGSIKSHFQGIKNLFGESKEQVLLSGDSILMKTLANHGSDLSWC